MQSSNELIARLLTNEVKADLLLLFHKNPGLIDTMEGIARRIGRTAPAVEKDVQDFAQLGLIRVRKYEDATAVSFNREKDDEIQSALLQHLKSFSEEKEGAGQPK